ncbi:NAD(P)-binding domain-containing protein [Ramlibacter sp. 2FC]|uniref:NAD(P)-dependent oxidoreductase n=1 Tax=Ramlibacter sp. 2FC TaxID=2502188 RepID=UPI0010F9FE1E|nr:NAD(P)-binding domain-containing protein [Ramlibacter sp. 2FC]
MNVGYLGSGPLTKAVVRRLSKAHQVYVLGSEGYGADAIPAASFAHLSSMSDVVIIGAGAPNDVRQAVISAGALAEGLSAGKIVIDQTCGDPEQTRALAAELQGHGVTLVDAPIHCELVEMLPDTSAIMCGGPTEAVEAVRPVLEAICPKVIHFGESGTGHAARLVIAAIAACNRMITYECAAVGWKNGLSIADMATVLNRSSGQNSASERVLPLLSKGGRSSDLALADVLRELRMASKLGARVGAPMLIANLVTDICDSLATQLGPIATLDDTVRVVESAAGIRFADGDVCPNATA